jgi:hypothetical protein
MTACASLIPIKANAAGLTLAMIPYTQNLQRNPGDSLTFLMVFDVGSFRIPAYIQDYSIDYDPTELSLVQTNNLIGPNYQSTTETILAYYIFEVLESVVKDGQGDISATVNYREPRYFTTPEKFLSISSDDVYDIEPVSEPVPEPLTILGAATALGYGAILKRQYFKNKKS